MADHRHFLDGGGEMAAAIRNYDWVSNPLGSPDTWPSCLKTVVSLALNSKFPKSVVWGPELITIHNDAFRPILGEKPPALGRPFSDVWSEVWDTIGPIAERAYAGEPTFIEDFPLNINRHGHYELAYFTFCYSPIRDEQGQVRGLMDTVIESTKKVEAEKRSRFLNSELTHRGKNMLAVVSAIVTQTMRANRSRLESADLLRQRINALAQVQSLLAGTYLNEAPIQSVIEAALSPFRSERNPFHLEGPSLQLASRQSLSLALAINELATNAMKYGALRSEAGSVSIRWTAGRPASDDQFHLSWIEEGGPKVSKPSRTGFGSIIVKSVIAQDFNGTSQIRFDESGLRFDLSTKMANLRDAMTGAS